MGFWKTVWAGVVIVGITKVLELSADHLPTWLGWLGAAATWLWGALSYTVPMPVIFALPVAAVIYKLASVIMELHAAADAKERALLAKEIAEREKAIKLTDEESTVVDALIHAEPPVDFEDLLVETRLSRLRLNHALTKLRERSFVMAEDGGYGAGYHFRLLPAGMTYVVQNNLDKPPF